jgi:hypothetical protein
MMCKQHMRIVHWTIGVSIPARETMFILRFLIWGEPTVSDCRTCPRSICKLLVVVSILLEIQIATPQYISQNVFLRSYNFYTICRRVGESDRLLIKTTPRKDNSATQEVTQYLELSEESELVLYPSAFEQSRHLKGNSTSTQFIRAPSHTSFFRAIWGLR